MDLATRQSRATGYDQATVAGDSRLSWQSSELGTRVNIVGHDLGGMVAYAYAAQNPDEVRSLSILDVEMSAGDREKSDSPS